MKKVTKKELVEKANKHEHRLFQIEKALEQHDINWFVEEPKLKVLDQSVFDGLDEKWRFAAVDRCGEVWACTAKTKASDGVHLPTNNQDTLLIGDCYDTSNWQNSLIERDKVELTGSDLCRKMLERGDRFVMCQTASGVDVISGTYEDGFFVSISNEYEDVTPINNQGEPLTAAEVGL